MIILHIAPINMCAANGLRFSVPGLTSAQNKIKGVKAALLNTGSSKNLDRYEVSNFDFKFFEDFKDFQELPAPFNSPDIFVFHGIYFLKYIKLYKKLLRLNIPYVIVPRVSLTEGAQKQKSLKKKIANLILFNKFIKSASKIHYLTENEKVLSSSFKNESFVVGNGINLPTILKRRLSKHKNITFIGRYDLNHKGLDILIESLIGIKNDLRNMNAKVRLYGSDYKGGKEYIENQIKKYNMQDIVIVNDVVYGNDKHLILLKTDVFISTSRFEGHPMAVIEAMSYGVPCILTEGTNMLDKLLEYDAGWATELDKSEIAKTILSALNNKEDIIKKGYNARKLVEENYTWNKVAYETVKNYRNIINTGR